MNSFGDRQPEPVTAELLTRMPKLRIIVYLGQSHDPLDYASFVDLEAIRRAGVALATTPAGDAVAEAAIGMIIAADLNLVAAAGDPSAPIRRRGLAGSALGIVGLGQIGRRVAEIGLAMGMAIRYTSRREHQAKPRSGPGGATWMACVRIRISSACSRQTARPLG